MKSVLLAQASFVNPNTQVMSILSSCSRITRYGSFLEAVSTEAEALPTALNRYSVLGQ